MQENKKNSISIAVASGKGGTGKTMLSLSLFNSIKNKYDDVVLLDADAEEPNDLLFFDAEEISSTDVTQKIPIIDVNKCKFCGKCRDWCNYNAIFLLASTKFIKLTEELCHGCGACSVACEFGAITEKDASLGSVKNFICDGKKNLYEAMMHQGVMTPVNVIKVAHKITNKHKIRIIDSPPGTSCPFIHAVAEVDYIILITEPTPFGLSDLKQSISTLESMNKKYGVVVNKAGLGNRAIYDYLSSEGIELLLEIPFDKDIARKYSEGKIISDFKPELAKDLEKMFDYLLNKYGNSSN